MVEFMDRSRIYENLIKLAKNPNLITRSSRSYITRLDYDNFFTYPYLFLKHNISLHYNRLFLNRVLWWDNPQACGATANAIMEQNIFRNKYISYFDTYQAFIKHIKNREFKQCIYDLSFNSCIFVNNDINAKTFFCGHAMILIKFEEHNIIKYMPVQSFIDYYDLNDYLTKVRPNCVFEHYDDLYHNFLIHLERIINLDIWSYAVNNAFMAITHVDSSHLLNHSPDNPQHRLKFIVEYTSDTYPLSTMSYINFGCNIVITVCSVYNIYILSHLVRHYLPSLKQFLLSKIS